MKTKTYFMHCFVLLLVLLVVNRHVVAQNKGELQNQEVITIEGESQRKVEKATKLAEKPGYRDSSITQPNVQYNAVPAQATTTIVPEPLKAANLTPKEKLDKLYKFYTRLGVGNYTNILGEVYFNQERHATSDYGVHYKHFSSQGGVNDVGFSGMANNEVNVYGSRILENYKVGADLLYKRNGLYYYGYNPDSVDLNKGNTKQAYNTLWLRLSGATNHANDSAKIVHRENLGYRPYFDNRGAMEHNVKLDLEGGKRLGKEFYGLGFMADYNYIKDDSCNCLYTMKEPVLYKCIQEQANMILGLNPSVTTMTGKLKIKVGLMINADIYDEGKFYFFPDMDFSYSLFNDIFIPYAGISRKTIRNSLYTMSQNNPFILTNNDYINTNQKMDVYGGIKGTWSANLSFNSRIGYSRNENMPLFVSDTTFSYENRFKIVYDNVDMLTADAHILYRATTKWHVLLGGTFYKYNMTNEEFAWHMPQFKVYSTLNYNLKDKIVVRWNLEVLGQRKAYSYYPIAGVTQQPDGKYIINLKPFFDTDIQLEYRYTKRFSVFAHFNNLAGRYLRYYNYPYQAFNLLGGVTYMF